MARKRAAEEEDEDPELDMSSMIDVSFLLLIYFIVTSTLDRRETDLALTMPTSGGGSSDVEIDQMRIEVNSEGTIVVNDEPLDVMTAGPGDDPANEDRAVPLLMDKLRSYAETARLTDSDPLVIIAADDASLAQRFVDILNALADKDVEIDRVTIEGFQEDG